MIELNSVFKLVGTIGAEVKSTGRVRSVAGKTMNGWGRTGAFDPDKLEHWPEWMQNAQNYDL